MTRRRIDPQAAEIVKAFKKLSPAIRDIATFAHGQMNAKVAKDRHDEAHSRTIKADLRNFVAADVLLQPGELDGAVDVLACQKIQYIASRDPVDAFPVL